MRAMRYVTMMDPFQRSYGNGFTAALLIPALLSDIFFIACILASLGGYPPKFPQTLTIFHYLLFGVLCVFQGEL